MTATDSYLLLRALLDELARCGLRLATAAPGSRNTPVLLSLAAERRIATHSLIDERGAGFFALGAAKASGTPALVTCTSGTAAANLLPAVIEAHEAGVPLIVLTADRPPELRDVGAGQTIDQLKLYGDAVKLFAEVDLPQADASQLRYIRSLACRAFWTAAAAPAGPVHLNLPLREPLVLEHELPDDPPGGGGRADGRPWVTELTPDARVVELAAGAPEQQSAHRPASKSHPQFSMLAPRAVIVAGELPAAAAGAPQRPLGAELAELAASAQVPLLADPRSGARTGAAAIAHYDMLLRDPRTAQALMPEVVYRIGDLPTSKPLRWWLAALDTSNQVALSSDRRWLDPSASVAERWVAPPEQLLAALRGALAGGPDGDWLARWQSADRAVADAIERPLAASGLSEPAVIQALGAQLTAATTLFVAASMPIRDVELLFPARASAPRVLANRGANGIDGTISAAFGAAASGAEVVLLTGDVTAVHDLGGLLAATRNGLKLTIVLLNNDGGGIFDFLPVAGVAPQAAYERLIATPPGLSFQRAAELYGLGHTRPGSLRALLVALEQALAGVASTIIEVRTNRASNRELHRELERAALAALTPPSR